MKTMKTFESPLPDLADLFDERDMLRNQPDGESVRQQLRVVDFLIRVRRGTLGEMKLNGWQRDVANAYFTSEIRNV